MTDKVTIRQVYDTLIEVRNNLKELNGTVREHCEKIAVLQEKVKAQETALGAQRAEQKSNWDKVWDGALKPLIATIITAVITAVVLKGTP